jgi:hypothetical protein
VAIENPGAIPQDRFEGFMEGSSKMQIEDVVEAQEALADSSNTSWDSGLREPNSNLSESLVYQIWLMLNPNHECRGRRT